MSKKPTVLMILDGYGLNTEKKKKAQWQKLQLRLWIN